MIAFDATHHSPNTYIKNIHSELIKGIRQLILIDQVN